jgi:type IV pilus assembly protein PilB
MKKLYQRAVEALAVVSRPDFVSGADLVPSITGHSIPREETVRHLLGLIPEIEPDHVVTHVGGGSGYLTAVLADLAHRVVYVDRNPALVEKARERFFKHGAHNVDVVEASADTGLELDSPCDLILCTTFIPDPKMLLPNLREGGNLVCLEGRAGPVPSVAMFQRKGDKLERVRTLGWVDFNRNSEQILIDLGVVSEAALSTAVAPRKGEHWQQAWALRSLIH